MNIKQSPIIENSVKVYRLLLYLYPKEHRDEYSWLMVQFFRDKAYDAYTQDGDVGIILHWLASLLDLFISVVNERREKGFSMSFNFLGKVRTPLLILAGILLALSAYGQLRPVAWYIASPLHDAADALMIPAFFAFGIGLLGLMMTSRHVMSKIAQVALIGVILACLSLSIIAALETAITIPFWSDNAWYFFMILMMVIMVCLIIFCVSMIQSSYRVMGWLLIHPILMLLIFAINIVQQLNGQVTDTDGEPQWLMFSLIVSWGISWIIAGYLLRADLSQKEKSSGKKHYNFDQAVQKM